MSSAVHLWHIHDVKALRKKRSAARKLRIQKGLVFHRIIIRVHNRRQCQAFIEKNIMFCILAVIGAIFIYGIKQKQHDTNI